MHTDNVIYPVLATFSVQTPKNEQNMFIQLLKSGRTPMKMKILSYFLFPIDQNKATAKIIFPYLSNNYLTTSQARTRVRFCLIGFIFIRTKAIMLI